jgi:hypothetical protein
MLRFSYFAALGGLGFALFGTEGLHWPFAYLFSSISFTFCWLLWFACAVSRTERDRAALLGLWLLIDLGILIQLTVFEYAHGHGSLSGTEFLYLFSFAPVILPSGLILSRLAGFASTKLHLGTIFGSSLGYVLTSWVEASLIAAVQSVIIVWGFRRAFLLAVKLPLRLGSKS